MPRFKGCEAGKAPRPSSVSDRDIRRFRELRDFALGAGKDDAVPGENHRAFRLIDQRERFVEFLLRREKSRDFAVRLGSRGLPIEFAGAQLGVLGDVHQHRAGPIGSRDQESLAQARGDLLGARDQIIVLGDGEGDAGDVRFLKGVGADHRAAHLAR